MSSIHGQISLITDKPDSLIAMAAVSSLKKTVFAPGNLQTGLATHQLLGSSALTWQATSRSSWNMTPTRTQHGTRPLITLDSVFVNTPSFPRTWTGPCSRACPPSPTSQPPYVYMF
eukprot:EG_transcript_17646